MRYVVDYIDYVNQEIDIEIGILRNQIIQFKYDDTLYQKINHLWNTQHILKKLRTEFYDEKIGFLKIGDYWDVITDLENNIDLINYNDRDEWYPLLRKRKITQLLNDKNI